MYLRFTSLLLVLVVASRSMSQSPEQAPPPRPVVSVIDTEEYLEVLENLRALYYDPDAVNRLPIEPIFDEDDRDEKITRAFEKLGNPWTHYYSPATVMAWRLAPSGRVDPGLSVRIKNGAEPVVQLVLFQTAAEKAGLARGDRIVTINGTAVAGLTTDEVYELLLGRQGEHIDISFKREGETLHHARLTLQEPAHDVEARLLPGGIAYFHIRDFSSSKMLPEFAASYAKLYAQANGQLHGVILDLRGNPGGYMRYAYSLMSAFIKPGTVLGYYNHRAKRTEERAKAWLEEKLKEQGQPAASAASMQRLLYTVPLVELTNGSTMSAAEATTAAMKETGRATVIGETTWGKGMQYLTVDLSNGGYMTIVTGKFTGPRGVDHHGTGIAPDKAVPDKRTENADLQLAAALVVLSPPVSTPSLDHPWSLPTWWFISVGGATLVIVVICYRRRRRRLDAARFERAMNTYARLEEARNQSTPYDSEGNVDWAGIVSGRTCRRTTVHKPTQKRRMHLRRLRWTVLEESPDALCMSCHRCLAPLYEGDRVGLVTGGTMPYYCCAECGATMVEAARSVQATA
jgi:carboxyl-terminal processing protease